MTGLRAGLKSVWLQWCQLGLKWRVSPSPCCWRKNDFALTCVLWTLIALRGVCTHISWYCREVWGVRHCYYLSFCCSGSVYLFLPPPSLTLFFYGIAALICSVISLIMTSRTVVVRVQKLTSGQDKNCIYTSYTDKPKPYDHLPNMLLVLCVLPK